MSETDSKSIPEEILCSPWIAWAYTLLAKAQHQQSDLPTPVDISQKESVLIIFHNIFVQPTKTDTTFN